jgi:transcriptional regulator with XRE-family HTH domain
MYIPDPVIIARNVTYYRLLLGYDYRQLGRQALLEPHVIEDLERGFNIPTSNTLRAVSEALGVRKEQLLYIQPDDAPYQESC